MFGVAGEEARRIELEGEFVRTSPLMKHMSVRKDVRSQQIELFPMDEQGGFGTACRFLSTCRICSVPKESEK